MIVFTNSDFERLYKESFFTRKQLAEILYELFLPLNVKGMGASHEDLKNAVVGKVKKNFWDANRQDYKKALKAFFVDFFENNTLADFSNVEKEERNNYAKKFKSLSKKMRLEKK